MGNVQKFKAGATFPAFSWPAVAGGTITPAAHPGWRLVVIYRGKHCPLCTRYLARMDAMQTAFAAAGLTVWAVSADPIERATAQAAKQGWTLSILAGLSEEEMRTLGLYISSPRSAAETDRNFAEPGTFVINPDGKVQIIDVSNAPFARPDPDSLLAGIAFVMAKHYPVRGMIE